LNSPNKRYTMFHVQSVSRTVWFIEQSVWFIEQSNQALHYVSRTVWVIEQ